MSLKWIVAVEPDGEHDGPLQLAGWLQARSGDEQDILGVYVLPHLRRIDPSFGPEEDTAFHAKARETCVWALERAGVKGAIRSVELIDADAIDEGIQRSVEEHGPYACIVGRRARRGEEPLQRLGPVARRLLRHAPAPLLITPPDWEAPSPEGPVLLATDIADSSLAAAGFARTVARSITAPVLAVHVAASLTWGVPFVEPTFLGRTQAQLRASAGSALHDWLRHHQIDGVTQRVEVGDPVARLAEVAKDVGAAMIVCGSRQLGTTRRVLGHSVASELAGIANVAVAIVPF